MTEFSEGVKMWKQTKKGKLITSIAEMISTRSGRMCDHSNRRFDDDECPSCCARNAVNLFQESLEAMLQAEKKECDCPSCSKFIPTEIDIMDCTDESSPLSDGGMPSSKSVEDKIFMRLMINPYWADLQHNTEKCRSIASYLYDTELKEIMSSIEKKHGG